MILNERSERNLLGVHPRLVAVVRRAAQARGIEFIVTEGLRTVERQRQLVAAGASQTMLSRHLTGHAVDLAPTVDGAVRWDWPLFYPLAAAMKEAALGSNTRVTWGGDWPRFKDGPHFEIDPTEYPMPKARVT